MDRWLYVALNMQLLSDLMYDDMYLSNQVTVNFHW